jgi:hypothetical protein
VENGDAMNPRDFYADVREPVQPVLRRFVRYVLRDAKISVQGPARVISTRMGKQVIYEPPRQVFPGSFQARKAGVTFLEISDGLVGGLVPYLDGRPLDGLDKDGEPLPEGKPRLECKPPEQGDRSYVLLWARHDGRGELDDSLALIYEPAAVIEHETELPPGMREEGRVARLVAVVYWQGGQIIRLRQVLWYDQEVFPSGGKARMRAAS